MQAFTQISYFNAHCTHAQQLPIGQTRKCCAFTHLTETISMPDVQNIHSEHFAPWQYMPLLSTSALWLPTGCQNRCAPPSGAWQSAQNQGQAWCPSSLRIRTSYEKKLMGLVGERKKEVILNIKKWKYYLAFQRIFCSCDILNLFKQTYWWSIVFVTTSAISTFPARSEKLVQMSAHSQNEISKSGLGSLGGGMEGGIAFTTNFKNKQRQFF